MSSEPESSEAVAGHRVEDALVYRWGQWLVQESRAWKEKKGTFRARQPEAPSYHLLGSVVHQSQGCIWPVSRSPLVVWKTLK